MAKPSQCDLRNLKRLARYLIDKQRYVTTYVYQGPVESVTVWTDSDWAGCVKTRRSTTGGIVMMGRHPIKHWASQQGLVALSSGEAEYWAILKAVS